MTKKIIIYPKFSNGEILNSLFSNNGCDVIPDLHTPKFFNKIKNSEILNKLKNEEYCSELNNIINIYSKNSVIVISENFFTIPRKKLNCKYKNDSINFWLKVFGIESKFIYFNTDNQAYRSIQVNKDDPIYAYKYHIRKDERDWNSNSFEHKGQILIIDLKNFVDNPEENIELIEEHLEKKLKVKEFNFDENQFIKDWQKSIKVLPELKALKLHPGQ